jgi:hypothetical protein
MRQTILSLLIILLLALSLAALPYAGLPYTPLKVSGLEVTQYADPPSKLFMPLLQRVMLGQSHRGFSAPFWRRSSMPISLTTPFRWKRSHVICPCQRM